MSKSKKIQSWIIPLVIFVVSLLPRILICFKLYPYSVYDEGPVLAVAAKLAGLNWDDVTAKSAYYGFGYYSLFFPLFKLVDGYVNIYFVITLINSIVQSLYGVIAYHIMRQFFEIEDKIFLVTIGVLSSYLTTVRPIVYNEIPLVLIVWIISYSLCMLIKHANNRRIKIVHSAIIFVMIAWSLTIHTRSLVFLFSLIFVAILCFIFYRRLILSIWVLPLGGVLIFATNIFVKHIQKLVWAAGTREIVHNTSVSIDFSSIKFSDITTWKSIFLTAIGQIHTLNLYTAGLFVFSIVIYVIVVFRFLKKKEIRDNIYIQYFVVVGTFLFACMIAMTATQSVSWMYSIYPPLKKMMTGAVNGYKAFSYIRYLAAFVGPFILCSICLVHKDKMHFTNGVYLTIGGFTILISKLWATYVLPMFEGNNYALEAFIPFCFRVAYEPININQYTTCLAWITLFVIVFAIAFVLRKEKIYYFLCLIVLIYEPLYSAICNDSPYGYDRSHFAVQCKDVINLIDSSENISKNIYVCGSGPDVQRLQVFLYDYSIKPYMPDYCGNNEILIYHGNPKDLNIECDSNRLYYVNVDSNYHVLFFDDVFIPYLEENAFNVTELNTN